MADSNSPSGLKHFSPNILATVRDENYDTVQYSKVLAAIFSVMDPHHLDADADSNFYLMRILKRTFHPDPDPSFQITAQSIEKELK